MEALFSPCISVFATVVSVAMIGFLGHYFPNIIWTLLADSPNLVSSNDSIGWRAEKKYTDREFSNRDETDIEDLKTLKLLYHQLHSLENFPHVLPRAKRLLLSLLKETNTKAQALSEQESILSVQSFSRQALENFQHRRDTNIGKEWERYNVRRKKGGPRELFKDREEATWWLKQISPVKYVDGAWLGHIGKVTTPFALQKTMKGAWQILSEELGDGDVEKNHVHLYRKLLETVAPGFPTADEFDFGHPRHCLDNISVWKSAVVQLLISLFPTEFLAEILGFNLHFEAISMDTLKAGMELKEVGIDPYYFILHISIDNAHSGHSAIAIEIVCEYMDYIRRCDGEAAVQKAWKKVQAGYLLSSELPGTAVSPSKRKPMDSDDVFLSTTEAEVMRIFKAKAQFVHGIHCSSRVRIGSRSVADWLDPIALESKRWQRGLLDALSGSKYWIRRGDSSESRFIQELQWNGRMFGSFTQDEYDAMRAWIDALPNICEAVEDSDSMQGIDNKNDGNILSGYPVFQNSSRTFASTSTSLASEKRVFSFRDRPSGIIGGRPNVEGFLPLWLSHQCLLQGFISVPFRTKSKFACTVIKILRAQGGFDIEQECVAGMGEVRRPNSLGLSGIGMNMMQQHGGFVATLPSLKHVLEIWPSEFVVHMLHVSMRPIENKAMLIGMATAFAEMHAEIVSTRLSLLSTQDLNTLENIAQRELESLEFCWKDLETDRILHAKSCEGYFTAAQEIKKCFEA